jgi:predicted aspartyl protease
MRIVHLVAALPLTLAFSTSAFAQCGALKLLEEVQMESAGPGPSTVPVQINGVKQSLTFSTTGGATQISRDTAKNLNLEVTAGDTGLFDASGNPWHDRVVVKQFAVGRIQKENMNMPISPSNAVRVGLFSLNFMVPFDIDVDFGTNKLRFFSQDHCPGGVLYWQAPVAGVAPLTVEGMRITVPAMLDGKQITAVIDSSAQNTSVKTAVAQKILGLELGGPGTPLNQGGFGGGKSYTHTYGFLSIGNVSVKNVDVRIASDSLRETSNGALEAAHRSAVTQFELADPVLTIGMDVLRQLHIYLAFKENKLYLTPASVPVEPTVGVKSP